MSSRGGNGDHDDQGEANRTDPGGDDGTGNTDSASTTDGTGTARDSADDDTGDGDRPGPPDPTASADPGRLVDVDGVGPASAALLASAGVAGADLRERRVSYRELIDADVAPEVAADLRRRYSLPRSLRTGDDLTERSDAVTGLQGAERTWVARSAGEWQDISLDALRAEREAAEREDPDPWADLERPTPVAVVSGVGPSDAERLASAGITSVRQLARVDAGEVARLLDLDVRHVRLWRHAARDYRAD